MLVSPPKANEELERTILACFLLSPKLLKIYGGLIKESDFYYSRNIIIYKALMGLTEKGYNVDIVILANLLETKGKLNEIGGRTFLTSLVAENPLLSNVASYIGQLKRLSKSRQERLITLKLQQAIENDQQEEIAALKGQLLTIEKDYNTVKPQEITHWLSDFEKDYHSNVSGIMSPFPTLNNATTGFKRGELISLSGLSGAGKSLLALQFALEAVKSNFSTIYFSLEMSPNQMIPRFLSMVLNIEISQIKKRQIEYQTAINDKVVSLKERPIKFVFDLLDTFQINSISYVEQLENKLDFIIIDYFSLLQDRGFKNELDKEKEVINRLKYMAKKLDVSILIPTALSKEVSKRKSGEARAEDTIGSIHQTYTVDLALALSRERDKEFGTLSITKNRSGDYCSVPISFDKKYLMFHEVDTHAVEPAPVTNDFFIND